MIEWDLIFGRRNVIQLASVLIPIVWFLLAGSSNAIFLVGIYIALQIVAGLDVVLMLIGRFFPTATLWAIRVERWLGPFPWKKHD